MCAEWSCTAGYWKCKDGLQCIWERNVCNKYYDCEDESDEDPMMCNGTDCMAGYRKCWNHPQCRHEHLMCDGKPHCKYSTDEDTAMCAQWNCSDGHWRCNDGLQCIPINWVCDGNLWPTHKCRDESDENPAMCMAWNCSTGQECDDENGCGLTKCAYNLQCVQRKSICDGKFDCKDGSDELCNDGCLAAPLQPEEKDIVKKCQEDSRRCVSVKQLCDGIAQCPDASDETQHGCMCEDWGLMSFHYKEKTLTYCMNMIWAQRNPLNQTISQHKNIESITGMLI